MTEPGRNAPDDSGGEREGAAPSAEEAAGTGGLGRVDDQTATPPHGDQTRGAAYDLGGDSGVGDDTRDEPQSPSGT